MKKNIHILFYIGALFPAGTVMAEKNSSAQLNNQFIAGQEEQEDLQEQFEKEEDVRHYQRIRDELKALMPALEEYVCSLPASERKKFMDDLFSYTERRFNGPEQRSIWQKDRDEAKAKAKPTTAFSRTAERVGEAISNGLHSWGII